MSPVSARSSIAAPLFSELHVVLIRKISDRRIVRSLIRPAIHGPHWEYLEHPPVIRPPRRIPSTAVAPPRLVPHS